MLQHVLMCCGSFEEFQRESIPKQRESISNSVTTEAKGTHGLATEQVSQLTEQIGRLSVAEEVKGQVEEVKGQAVEELRRERPQG
jgi:hypothetical protein